MLYVYWLFSSVLQLMKIYILQLFSQQKIHNLYAHFIWTVQQAFTEHFSIPDNMLQVMVSAPGEM